jgi:putative membrane protein
MQGGEARGIERRSSRRDNARPTAAERVRRLAAVIAIPFAGAVVLATMLLPGAMGFGPLAAHMATHILLMNLVAPGLVMAWVVAVPGGVGRSVSGQELALATAVQLAALWAAHAPPVMAAAAHAHGGMWVVQCALLMAAVWFWLAVLATPRRHYWRSLLALAFTGKLFCMLGLLLVFAPHAFYADLAHAHGHGGAPLSGAAAVADQQQAGFLMVAACPIAYGLVALALAGLWIKAMGEPAPATRERG